MRRLISSLLFIALLLVPGLTQAAETIVEGTPDHPCGSLWFVDIVATADTDASFDALTTTDSYCGFLYAFSVIPGGTAPTANSDLDLSHTIAGSAAAEMLGAQGDNIIDNATNNYVTLTSEIAVCGPLAIDMENNLVNSASFTLRLYLRIPGTE